MNGHFTTDHLSFTLAVAIVMCSVGYVRPLDLFSECLNSTDECLERPTGQYPVCYECGQFFKCASSGSAVVSCSSGLQYDVALGVCNFEEVTQCRTPRTPRAANTTPASATSPNGTTHPPTTSTMPNPNELPTINGATSICTRTTFVCEAGYVWVGPGPQSVDFDITTMTWGTPRGQCVHRNDTDDNARTFPVQNTTDNFVGICLHGRPSAAETSRIVVSLLAGQDIPLRFVIDYSTNDTVISSVFDDTELYHLFLNADQSCFLDFNLPLQLKVLAVSETDQEYLVTDGNVEFTGTVQAASYHPCRVDTLEVAGDIDISMVNTRCESK